MNSDDDDGPPSLMDVLRSIKRLPAMHLPPNDPLPNALADVLAPYFGFEAFGSEKAQNTKLQVLYKLLEQRQLNYVVFGTGVGLNLDPVVFTDLSVTNSKHTSLDYARGIALVHIAKLRSVQLACFGCGRGRSLDCRFSPLSWKNTTRLIVAYFLCRTCRSGLLDPGHVRHG